MAATTLFVLVALLFVPVHAQSQSSEEGFISAVISQKGLDFSKDILVDLAITSLAPLSLPQIQKTVKIPLVGNVHIVLSNITIYRVDVSASEVKPGDTGITIVASGATANLSMNWYYSYGTWFIPIVVSDKGHASIQVEGLEVGLTLGLENQEGTLELSLMECSCFVKEISIDLDGGASWLYQGLVDFFEGQITSSVENAITKNMKEGVLKLDSLFNTFPKEIPVDEIAALNIAFVNDPMLTDSSIGFEIDGLFVAADKAVNHGYYHKISKSSVSCKGPPKMLEISIDEAVFNSASDIYFNVISTSASVEVIRNNLAGNVGLNDFTLTLKWSKVGNFHMHLIQSVMWIFLKTVFLPYVNLHLKKGFPLPIIRGFNLQNAKILCTNSLITVCSDVALADSFYNYLFP
ncbi:PREDICTED: putative BPI/LBP family protein At1g04970 isoform X2 [Nelumbo nucifera]|uniref:BPI/LBP family protein At1g04970 isoform X2 n=2 Tax=Nelumbo nucifera TaxID=4432 RepID=A0A1U7ZLL3_NELNU|nr:PREDICTED: putative BPI/LBP family protein At1g04970 isoform X2 [Nelumbo nucifera]DAD23533.1 TPA_asm: hypothetical protein HUJ06_024996 [Nelumbo nucifera]